MSYALCLSETLFHRCNSNYITFPVYRKGEIREIWMLFNERQDDRDGWTKSRMKNLWRICGQNSQHSAVTRWQRKGKNCKTFDFLGGCNFRITLLWCGS
jgi:hypothetical protein